MIPWEITDQYVRSGHGPVPKGGTCRTITVKNTRGIKAIVCKPPGGSMKIQSYLFPVGSWNMAQAKAWFRSHQNAINMSYSIFTINVQAREETDTHVIYKHICVSKEGVMNDAYKPPEAIKELYNYLNTYGISLPFTVPHPFEDSGLRHVTDWPEVTGNVSNWTLNESPMQIFGDIAIPKKHPEVIKGIDDGTNSDVSLGYWRDVEHTSGTFQDNIDGNSYEYFEIERKLFPNHVSGLPAGSGACSTKQGCGFVEPINELMNVTGCNRGEAVNMLKDFEDFEENATVSSPSWGSIKKTEQNGYKPSDFIIVGESVTASKLPYKYKGKIHCGGVRAAIAAIGGARSGKKMSLSSGERSKLMNAAKQCGMAQNCDCGVCDDSTMEELIAIVNKENEELNMTKKDDTLDKGKDVCPSCGTHDIVGNKCVACGTAVITQQSADFTTPKDALSTATNDDAAGGTPPPAADSPPAAPAATPEPAPATPAPAPATPEPTTKPEPTATPEPTEFEVQLKEFGDRMKKLEEQNAELNKQLAESRIENVKEILDDAEVNTKDIDLADITVEEAKAYAKLNKKFPVKTSQTNAIPKPAKQTQTKPEPEPEKTVLPRLKQGPGKFMGKDEQGNPVWEHKLERGD